MMVLEVTATATVAVVAVVANDDVRSSTRTIHAIVY